MGIIDKVQDMVTKAFHRNANTVTPDAGCIPVIYHLNGREYPGVVTGIVTATDIHDNPFEMALVSFIQHVGGRAVFNSASVTFDMLDEIIAA